jgi:hypothetical protein
MENSGKLSQAKQAISQTARDAASKVKSVAGDATSRAKTEAERLVTEKKEFAASRVGGYSNALHESARSLEQQDPNIAFFTHQAADRLQGVADYIRNRDFTSLREDCCSFSRQHPAAFFGGMFVAGLLLGNMMKATARPRQDDNESTDFDDTDWRTQAGDFSTQSSMQEDLPMSTSPLPSTTPGMSGM